MSDKLILRDYNKPSATTAPTTEAPVKSAVKVRDYATANAPVQKESAASGGIGDFPAGFAKGFVDYGRRFDQVSGKAGAQEAIDEAARLDKDLMESGYGLAGNVTANALTTALAAGLGSKIPVIGPMAVQAAKTYPKSAILGTGAGFAATTPVTSDDSTIGNMAEGALFNLGGTGAMNLIGKVGNTVIPPLVGKTSKWADKSKQDLFNYMRKNGLMMGAGDIGQGTTTRWMENVSGRLPFSGRPSWISDKVGEIGNIANRLGEKIGVSDMSLTEANETIKKSIKSAYTNAKKSAGQLYDDVSAASKNSSPIKMLNTKQAAEDANELLPDVWTKLGNTRAKNLVDKLVRATNQKSPVINPATGRPFTITPELTFDEARVARKILKQAKDQAWKQVQNGQMVSDEAQGLTNIFKAVEQDLDDWGMNTANVAVHGQYRAANQFYEDMVAPFKNPDKLSSNSPFIANMVDKNKGLTDKVGSSIIREDAPSLLVDVLKLTNNDPKTRTALQNVVLHKITNGIESSGAPQKTVVDNFNKISDIAPLVFSPNQMSRLGKNMEAFSMMSPTRFSDAAIANAENQSLTRGLFGLGELGGMGAAAFLGNPGVALGIGGASALGGKGVQMLTSTRPGINFLMSDKNVINPMVNKLGGLTAAAYSQNMDPDVSENVLGRVGVAKR